MRIAITGGSGFLGSGLAAQLATQHTVHVVDKAPLPPWFPAPSVHYHQADLEDFDDFFECDYVIHAASPVGPVGILAAGGQLGASVIRAVRRVIAWSIATGAKLIFISSSEVYGHSGRLSEDADCVFKANPSIRNEYAQSKLLSEIMISNTAKLNPGFSYQIVRPFNIAGPMQMPEKGFVLPRFVIQALNERVLTVYGDGLQRRAFSHLTDVARGIIAVMEADEKVYGKVWNIGHPSNCTTIRALAEMVRFQVGRGRIECCDPRSLHGPWFAECEEKIPDISQAQTLIGWDPSIPLDVIVAETIAFWSEGGRYLNYAHHV